MEDSTMVDVTREAFQKVKQWGAELMDKPSSTPYFYNMVIRLVHSMLKHQHHLTVGYQKSTLLLAWACRNLLELDIITQYCLVSPQNGKDFVDDMWIDGIEIFEAFKKRFQAIEPDEQTLELDETIANYRAEKAKRGLTRNKFLDVKELAKQVGMQNEYRHMNKVTSKLVHPTAFSVLAFAEDGELKYLRPIIFEAGNRYALEVYEKIKAHVDKRGMEP